MKRAMLSLARLTAFFFSPGTAQDYPSQNVTIIVPYPAGGPTDQLARVLAPSPARSSGRTSSSRTSAAAAPISPPAASRMLAGRIHAAHPQPADFRECRALPERELRHREGPRPGHLHQQQPAGAGRTQNACGEYAARASRPDEEDAERKAHPGTGSTGHLATSLLARRRRSRSRTCPIAARRRRCRISPAAMSTCSSPRPSRWCRPSRTDKLRPMASPRKGLRRSFPRRELRAALGPEARDLLLACAVCDGRNAEDVIDRLSAILMA